MKISKKTISEEIHPFWGSSFIKGIPLEIEKISEALGLELEYTISQPQLIDGDALKAGRVVFVINKRPWFLKETYCLYGLYEEGILKGFVGKVKDREIRTLKDLGSIDDLKKGNHYLYKWVQSLVKMTCDKI
ncbi:MAG: hypothetical protein ACK415_00265 [Thermodesulfovibrionales bacterium]